MTDQDHSVSYWQRGLDDGLAGRNENPPNNNGRCDRQNEGYHNGYRIGYRRRLDVLLTAKAQT